MSPKAYFDTNVWMAPYDDSNERLNQSEVVSSIEHLVEWHRISKVEIVTSREVVAELENHLLDARKCNKAKSALKLIDELQPKKLPRAPADCGKAICGETVCGVSPKFRDLPKDEADREVIEYMTKNGVDFFVSLDKRHIIKESTKKELEARLDAEKSEIVTPQELVARLSPDLYR